MNMVMLVPVLNLTPSAFAGTSRASRRSGHRRRCWLHTPQVQQLCQSFVTLTVRRQEVSRLVPQPPLALALLRSPWTNSWKNLCLEPRGDHGANLVQHFWLARGVEVVAVETAQANKRRVVGQTRNCFNMRQPHSSNMFLTSPSKIHACPGVPLRRTTGAFVFSPIPG